MTTATPSTSNAESDAPSTTSSNNSHPKPRHRRVAIVGGGVSGLSASWHLLKNSSTSNVDVTLFESSDRLGGHAHTITIPDFATNVDGTTTHDLDVDVGFMVYNRENYPNMTEWFGPEHLNVPSEPSDMSLSVSLDTGLEWSSHSILANPSNLIDTSFYSFLRDMLRFNREAPTLLLLPDDDPRRCVTTRQYLRENGYSEAFAVTYLLPMMAALWSASIEDVFEFPAEQLVGFLCNHRMLQLFDRPQWMTVANRSQSYTQKMTSLLGDRAKLNCPIVSVQIRKQKHHRGKKDHDAAQATPTYELFTVDDESMGTFDEIIFACHPPAVRSMLAGEEVVGGDDGNLDLLEALADIEYAPNVMYLHSDPALMPKRKKAWSSWNCIGKSALLSGRGGCQAETENSQHKPAGVTMEGSESGFGSKMTNGDHSPQETSTSSQLEGEDGRMRAAYVTYYLNRLQNLKTSRDVFVSLNPHTPPDPKLTHRRMIMDHPQFTPATLRARKVLREKYQGRNGLWFCGAWAGYGFHEDGCRSGFEVACELIDVPLPWVSQGGGGGGGREGIPRDGVGRTLVLPPPDLARTTFEKYRGGIVARLYKTLTCRLPVAICRKFVTSFLTKSISNGNLQLRLNDGTVLNFGDEGSGENGKCTVRGCDNSPVTLRVFDDWFFVKVAMEYDLGLARSYMSGFFVVEPLRNPDMYDCIIRPRTVRDETSQVLGDPVGLLRLFLLFIANRDASVAAVHHPMKSARNHTYSNAFMNASGLFISKLGSMYNFLRYKLTMDNSERGGSLKNIHAHYNLSNDLFTSFLDKETLMYSSAIYDAIKPPSASFGGGLVYRGTLEEAQWRKLDTLLDRAQVQPGQALLDIGFGWGGLCLHAARKYQCRVHGITLSVEQKALAEKRVRSEGLEHLITFEVVDYRTFARRSENQGRFDRVLSCEMIEAVGHRHLGDFFWAVEQVLHQDGVLVMEAITTPEERYESYLRSTDFINTIIFPGSCCPSLHALVDASYKNSALTLEHIDNIGLHYARTLAEWRRRFNANEPLVRKLGFDDVFLRVWNYYLTYCEAGFHSQTENCLILVFARPGCNALVPLSETRSVTQLPALTEEEAKEWIK